MSEELHGVDEIVPFTREDLDKCMEIFKQHRLTRSELYGTWLDETAEEKAMCQDRKSTRLNSSHTVISYAVFCLKKKKTLRAEAAMCMARCTAHRSSRVLVPNSRR